MHAYVQPHLLAVTGVARDMIAKPPRFDVCRGLLQGGGVHAKPGHGTLRLAGSCVAGQAAETPPGPAGPWSTLLGLSCGHRLCVSSWCTCVPRMPTRWSWCFLAGQLAARRHTKALGTHLQVPGEPLKMHVWLARQLTSYMHPCKARCKMLGHPQPLCLKAPPSSHVHLIMHSWNRSMHADTCMQAQGLCGSSYEQVVAEDWNRTIPLTSSRCALLNACQAASALPVKARFNDLCLPLGNSAQSGAVRADQQASASERL